jgi:F-type H+-transporting ATPase subunit epsilon
MEFNFKIVTPDGYKYQNKIASLNINTEGGFLTILAHHFPLVTPVVPSIMNIKEQDQTLSCFTSEGILYVKEDEVVLITQAFNYQNEIDIDRARNALSRALARLSTNDVNIDRIRANKAKIRAEARIALW